MILLILVIILIAIIGFLVYANFPRQSAQENTPCDSCGEPVKQCGCGAKKPSKGPCGQCGMPKPQCGCPNKGGCAFC